MRDEFIDAVVGDSACVFGRQGCPDCFGNLGVARELAGITGKKFVSPEWYLKTPKFAASSKLPFRVKVESKQVPRFIVNPL